MECTYFKWRDCVLRKIKYVVNKREGGRKGEREK